MEQKSPADRMWRDESDPVSCEKNISYRFLYRGKKGEKKKVVLELYVCVHTDKERERETCRTLYT
jgi:hypothetical protein